MIKKHFKDNRTIKCPTPKHLTRLDDDVHPGGEIFTTEDGDFIDLEIQFVDFDEEELAKYVEFAENLYEKHQKRVSVYLLCPKNINVSVREQKILSDADFSIKLACDQTDPCHMILGIIKRKRPEESAVLRVFCNTMCCNSEQDISQKGSGGIGDNVGYVEGMIGRTENSCNKLKTFNEDGHQKSC